MRAADALGLVRLASAVVFPGVLVRTVAMGSGWMPVVLFAVAAATDFFDGIVARWTGTPTRHGAILDNVADVTFVLAGTGTAAALGLVWRAVPIAIALAVGSYALASRRRSTGGDAWWLARSRLGHAAGVCNYALTGLVAGSLAIPGPAWSPVLALGSGGVVGLNLAAVLHRLLASG